MKGILAYSDDPLVSSNLTGDPHSSIFSAMDTLVIGGDLAKVVAWYDNEWVTPCASPTSSRTSPRKSGVDEQEDPLAHRVGGFVA